MLHRTRSGPGTERLRRDRSARIGIGTMLMLVALVPLVGVGVIAWRSVNEAEIERAAAERTKQLADSAVHIAQLDGAVFDELTWVAMIDIVDEIGIDLSAWDDAPREVDPVAGAAEARAVTDRLLDLVDDDLIRAGMERARRPELSLAELVTAFGDVDERIDGLLATAVHELGSAPLTTADSYDMQQAINVLQSSIDIRRGVSKSLFGFYATIFDLRGPPPVELSRLISLRQVQLDGIAQLTEVGNSDPSVAADLAVALDHPSMQQFGEAVDQFIARSLMGGVPEVGGPIDVMVILQHIDEFAVLYQSAMDTGPVTADLLDAAWVRISAAADVAVDRAANREREVLHLTLLLTAATGIAAIGATLLIVRPLRALRRSADALREPDGPVAKRVRGPIEVQSAGDAIVDAAAHLDLVAEQTRALADGELDAPVLHVEQSGGLGTDVQRAVSRLRSALSTQDEFRRRLAHEASHDGLTKIANRNSSMAQLHRSLARTGRSETQLAVLFVDLDRFKEVNDHRGHAAGDYVLATIAKRLVNEVREGDHVGRLGGDEFVVIAEPIESVHDAVDLAERLRAAIGAPITWEGHELNAGSSVGIAMADGMALTAEELLHDADLAVYRAKADGRSGVVVCDEELRRQLAESADLATAIRRGIERDEFLMHYQPIVDAVTHEIIAYEALVRWQRPDRDRPTPPDEFIGFAERSDLIIDLDCWVLGAVTSQVAAWADDERFAGLPVSINVSGRHLAHDRFVQHVLTPIARHGVDPGLVIIEITESALLEDLPVAGARLEMLRAEGVRVAIDDFGTGYTSLAHLRALPIDTLKIDRSFIHDDRPDGSSLLKLIIDTGHLLGASVTAEGVETAEEVRRLASLGSDSLQGYYFARPAPYEPDMVAAAADPAS